MPETDEQKLVLARTEIKAAVEKLLVACENHNAAFLGFVYGMEPPFLMQFGNVIEKGMDFRTLLNGLCDLVDNRQDNIVQDPLFQNKDLN